LSHALAEQGELKKSLETAFKVLEIDPLYKLAYNWLAYLYDRTGDHEKSIWAINKYIELAPNEANPYDSRGDLYANNGQVAKAIASYRKATEVDPRFVASAQKLGGLYVEQGEYTRADSVFRELSTRADSQVQLMGRRGLTLIPIHQGRFREAIRLTDAGLKYMRDKYGEGALYAKLLSARSACLHFAGDLKAAEEDMNRSLKIQWATNPEKWLLYKDRSLFAIELADLGRHDSALSVVQGLRALASDVRLHSNPGFWVSLASAELALGDLDSATAHAEWAVQVSANFIGKLMLGGCYLKAGRLGDAVKMLEGAESMYDQSRMYVPVWSVRLHYWLGQAYEQSGWNDKAGDEYRKFLDIWKNADPGIKEVADAKKRLAAMQT